MDTSSNQWIAELGIMEPLEYNVSLSPESLSSCTTNNINGENGVVAPPHLSFQRPTKLLKTNSWGSSSTSNEQVIAPNYNSSPSSTSPQYFSFANPSVSPPQLVKSKGLISHVPADSYEVKQSNGSKKRVRSSAPNLMSQDHVIAERRRREQLSQKFIALSALIPGLKKMDKASVLGDAVKHIKHLQERVKTLEEKVKRRNSVESVSLLKKAHVSTDDDDVDSNSSSCNLKTSTSSVDVALPKIEAKVMDKDVLLRIYCEKQHGLLRKILKELDNLHLSVSNSNFLPFGDYDLIITVTAEMKADFCIRAKDLVSKLMPVFEL